MNKTLAGNEQNAVPTVVIRGTDRGWTLRAGELWQHRELLYFLAMRDIKVRYKQTVLGFAWAILQPLGIALTLTLFLGRFVHVPSEGLPYLVFAYSAMTVWQLFANALTNAAALLDLEAIVIDGELDRQLVREIIRRTERVLDRFEWEGMVRPQLLEGAIGADARAMGGAILPLYAHFAPVHELFLKPAAETVYQTPA